MPHKKHLCRFTVTLIFIANRYFISGSVALFLLKEIKHVLMYKCCSFQLHFINSFVLFCAYPRYLKIMFLWVTHISRFRFESEVVMLYKADWKCLCRNAINEGIIMTLIIFLLLNFNYVHNLWLICCLNSIDLYRSNEILC